MTFHFAGFVLHPDSRRLVHQGADLHLTPKAFDLLALLVAAAPRVLRKAELHARLWPDSFVSDATLAGLVKELRKTVGACDGPSEIVRTVTRVGYACAVPVNQDVDAAAGRRHWLVTDGRSFPLRHGSNAVGREPDSPVWLDDASVSRRHACITIGDGARIEDLGSKNGTKVNAEQVVVPVSLQDGDQVTIGKIVLLYRCAASGLSTEPIGQ